MPDRVIHLTISATGTGAAGVFTFHLRLDNDVIAANQALTVPQSQAVRTLAADYARMFEQPGRPRATRATLAVMGAQLFDLWLAASWPRLSESLGPGDPRLLVICSNQAVVLNLPWELLRPAGGEAIGVDGEWSLRRLPSPDRLLKPGTDPLPAGPLRVLYMVAAPTDQAELDFEREEERLLRAFGRAGGSVVYDSCDLGSFEELGERIGAFRPHIVHLTGHGEAKDDTGSFIFEDEHGRSDPRSAAELGQLFAGSGVQCAFVSACQAGRAPVRDVVGGLAQGLLAKGVRLVIGWTASVLDDVATEVAAGFYGAVSKRWNVDRALVKARQDARLKYQAIDDPSWSLAVLYAGTRQAQLFDRALPPEYLRRPLVLQALPGLTEGFSPHFIGRRRELQTLLPGLRTGDIQAVVLTGLGGAGKSTLATRLASKLQADGWTPLALSSSAETPLSTGQLLEECGQAFLDAGQDDAYATLRNANLPVADRLRATVTGLNRGRFVLVLDNFESNLDEVNRRILDAELAGFYRYLLGHLVGGSRVLITSRYLPADMALPATATELQLGEFSEAAFLKFLLRDPELERRYRKGDLPHGLLVRLHKVLGATPRFLGQIRKELASMAAKTLEQELDRVALPTAADEAAQPGRLQAARDKYCETIFTERLFGRLSPAAQNMLSRAAVFGLPVTMEGLVAVAAVPEPEVRVAADQAAALALMHRTAGDLWSVYGMLRSWLLAPGRLSTEAKQAAHLAAGDFLAELDRLDREGELGVSWIACLLEARMQYLAADAMEQARTVTGRISDFYVRQDLYSELDVRQSLYAELERLHAELLAREEHPDTLGWLGRSLLERGHYPAARQSYQLALAMHERTANGAGEASVLHSLASIDLNEDAYPAAREKFERSLKIKQQIGDRAGEAATWQNLASIDLNEGDYPSAREKFERSLAIKQQIGDRAGEAGTWHQLATIDLNEGAYPAAREKFGRVLAIDQQIGNRAGEATTWHHLASIDLNEGAYPAAREKFERALKIKQQIGDRAGEAGTWHQLATIDLREGGYPAAREKFERSLVMRQQIGDRAGEAATLHQLATIDLNEGVDLAAREKFERALAIDQQIGDRAGEAGTWHQLAAIDVNEGAYPAAREKFERALAIAQQIGDRAGEAATWHNLASIDLNEGATPAAREKFERALAMRQQIGDRAGEAATWHNLATIDLREGATPAAREKSERALAMRQQIGDRAGEAATWHQLASIDLNDGAYPAAREKFERALAIAQQVGDRAGEAATWHNLASIDVNEGATPAAREKFERALEMRQKIGDRYGEAATWFRLGQLAAAAGNVAQGLPLVALCYLIDQAIGHSDTKQDWNAVAGLSASLEYTQEQLDTVLMETGRSYAEDRGASLLGRAFEGTVTAEQGAPASSAPNPAPFAPGIATTALRSPRDELVDAEYPVWFGTNRRPNDPGRPEAGYSSNRSDTVHYGVCRVFIPKSHKIGSIGSPWWKRLLKGTDDRLRLLSLAGQPADAFWPGVAAHLADLAMDDQTALIFVHGYNVSFEAAALRAAQIGFDLSFKGAMAFFSWPSRGVLEGYPADEATIDASEDAIADFMTGFVQHSGARAVHVIAHSMGNRGVLRAVNRIVAQAQQRTHIRFGQIILAAADVDADVFRKLSAAYAQVAQRTTLYISARDLAVESSRWLHDFPRAGLLPPVLVADHIDTINVTNADLTLLGHGYVADSRGVLQDMHALLAGDAPPGRRFGLREVRTDANKPYWLIGA